MKNKENEEVKIIKYFKEMPKKQMWFFLGILLLINFIIRLVIYYNTTIFHFSDYSTYLQKIELINKYGSFPLSTGNFSYLNSHIGYFFKYILGNIDYYFIFNCFLGTLTSLTSFFIIREITPNRLAALLVVLFQTVYVEFVAFSSIFYTPIIMIFILNLIILFIIKYAKTFSYNKILFFSGMITVLTLFSLYLKAELKYFWVLLIMVGLVSYFKNKDKSFSKKFIILGIILFILQKLLIMSGLYPTPPVSNGFIFFGHTLYGGDGGEGAFIYPENEKKYDIEFQKYLTNNNISKPILTDKNRFRMQEVKKFVFKHPLKWIKLQFYKFFRTFGIVPEGSTFKMMMSGITKGKWIFTSILLVLPVSFFVILFLLVYNFSDFRKIINNNVFIFLSLFAVYYIMGTVFYGHFSERYRMPFVVTFLIPYIAYKLSNFKFYILTKKQIAIKIILVILTLSIWGFQAYEALYQHRDRYFRAVDKVVNIDPDQ